MRLHRLSIQNVGPFARAELDLDAPAGVTLLTGLNGSGKTTILDAIRFWFGGQYGLPERELPRVGTLSGFAIHPIFSANKIEVGARVTSTDHTRVTASMHSSASQAESIWSLPNDTMLYGAKPSFVVDYWCPSTTAVGAYEINALERPAHAKVLIGALEGAYTRARSTQLICHAEFLRESPDPAEAALGAKLLQLVERIINQSLLEGHYLGVTRSTLTPMVEQAGHRVPLSGLSAGNAYQINRLLGLLWRMYSVAALCGGAAEALNLTPGLLLIDEAENHLHPRWQKRFLPTVRELFPNVQIVATTHSPFVLASVPGARVYVTRFDSAARHCTVTDETGSYANLSIEEILLSDAFDQTQPWGEEVTRLLAERTRAVTEGDDQTRREINARLAQINPVAFGWLRVENDHGRSEDSEAT